MPDRTGFVPEFAFDKRQVKILRSFLKGDDERAHAFICQTAHHVRLYLWERGMFTQDPIPRPKQVREHFAELAGLAGRLADSIERLDPVAGQTDIVIALCKLGRSESFLEDLTEELRYLTAAANATLPKLPQPRGGHPERSHEIGLIAQIAADHRRIYGRLPAKSRWCWFHQYIQAVLKIACPDDPLNKVDCSRLVQKAVERVIEVDKRWQADNRPG